MGRRKTNCEGAERGVGAQVSCASETGSPLFVLREKKGRGKKFDNEFTPIIDSEGGTTQSVRPSHLRIIGGKALAYPTSRWNRLYTLRGMEGLPGFY